MIGQFKTGIVDTEVGGELQIRSCRTHLIILQGPYHEKRGTGDGDGTTDTDERVSGFVLRVRIIGKAARIVEGIKIAQVLSLIGLIRVIFMGHAEYDPADGSDGDAAT